MSAGYQGPMDESIYQNHIKHNSLVNHENPEYTIESSEEDRLLKTKIKDLLKAHVEIDVSKVEVFVKNHFVSLTGIVDSEQARATVKGIVESIDNIQEVVSFIEIDKISPIARNTSGEKDFSARGPI